MLNLFSFIVFFLNNILQLRINSYLSVKYNNSELKRAKEKIFYYVKILQVINFKYIAQQ